MANAILHECMICGATFRHKNHRANKFCGAACYHEAQRRGLVKGGREAIHVYPCAQCGKQIKRHPSERRNGEKSDKVFCSRECYNAYRAEIIQSRAHSCKGCGASIAGPGVSSKTLYCSQACKVRHKKPKPSKCLNCGVMFSAIRPQERANGGVGWVVVGQVRTCSPECHNQWIRNNPERKRKIGDAFRGSNHPNWQGGKSQLNNVSNRGPNWHRQRAKAVKRDHNKCVDCGITGDQCREKFGRGLDVDHIVPYHNFSSYLKANRLANLACRCASCHRKAEAQRHMVQMVLPMQDSIRRQHKGRDSERHPRAKLTWLKVKSIRMLHAKGATARELADMFECKPSNIYSIAQGKTWRA